MFVLAPKEVYLCVFHLAVKLRGIDGLASLGGSDACLYHEKGLKMIATGAQWRNLSSVSGDTSTQ
jgi:hypothetical protein